MLVSRTLAPRRAALITWVLAPSRPLYDAVCAFARLWPVWLSLGMGVAVFARTLAVWAPEGDSALHFRLMQDIADTATLPRHLPHFAARVGPGGEIEAMFPYGYTPLFHALGAALYRVAGTPGVALMNGAAAAIIARVVYALAARRLPAYVASAAALTSFVAPTTISIFTHVYMEPVMLAFVFAGAWHFYVALATRSMWPAMFAGALLGLAVATRQVALLYGVVLAILGLVYLFERRSIRLSKIGCELRWLVPFAGAFALTTAPSLLYLWVTTGTVGYGDLALPGTTPSIAIDPFANAYIANITNPDLSPLHWIDRYRVTLLYSERWLPGWFAALPLAFGAIGVSYMERRGGGARFLARFAVIQLVTEMLVFAVLHGNDRYVITSRMLFYATLPVGLYAAALWLKGRWARYGVPERAVAGGALLGAAAALVVSLFGGSYVDFLAGQQRLMSARSDAYADAGAWANANTPPDALFLAPRVYSGELAFERDLTWVTFYGNAWVVDAISSPDPDEAHAILSKYGVDYVLIADPPGTYVDRMPPEGMRSYLQFGREPARYFELVYTADSDVIINGREVAHPLRIYRVLSGRETTAELR